MEESEIKLLKAKVALYEGIGSCDTMVNYHIQHKAKSLFQGIGVISSDDDTITLAKEDYTKIREFLSNVSNENNLKYINSSIVEYTNSKEEKKAILNLL